MPLAGFGNRGGGGGRVSGDGGRRRRGRVGGGARGDRALPWGVLGRDWGRSERRGRSGRRSAAALLAGGGSPAALEGDGRVYELHGEARKVVEYSI